MNKRIELPDIDGHFWIVRDGKIIDWDFPEYAQVRRMWGCGKEKTYLPAPEMTQKLMIGMFKKAFSSHFSKTQTWEEILAEFHGLCCLAGAVEPQYCRCFQNCLLEIHLRGGELVFGSLGFKRPDGSFHYEYGGTEYKTIADFRGQTKGVGLGMLQDLCAVAGFDLQEVKKLVRNL
jgi:hypothetical protein